MHDYIINAKTIRECNFAMGTIILGKGFAQALAFSTCAINSVCTCALAKPFPKIVPMVKLDIPSQKKFGKKSKIRPRSKGKQYRSPKRKGIEKSKYY